MYIGTHQNRYFTTVGKPYIKERQKKILYSTEEFYQFEEGNSWK
jgi:hypothetical protein